MKKSWFSCVSCLLCIASLLSYDSSVYAQDSVEESTTSQVSPLTTQEATTSSLLEENNVTSTTSTVVTDISGSETSTQLTTTETSQTEPFTTETTSTSTTELTISQETTTSSEQDPLQPKEEAASVERPIYRLYHPITGEHLYTTDINEKNILYGRQGWGYEGISWYAPNTGKAVYRLYNAGLKNHLYTSDTNEVRQLTTRHGWKSDNNGKPVFYSAGSTQIYRLYNPKLRGLHHWTTDINEYRILPRHGWRQEGATFSGLRKGSPIQTQYAADEALASQIKGFGGYQMSSANKRELIAAIKALRSQGYSIGFMLMDVHSQKGIEYNADQQFYAASTVKGPYVASLAAKNPASIRESGAIMRQVLNYSSNEGYLFLFNRYYTSTWSPWLSEAGVRTSMAKTLYPYYSTRELFKLWKRNYTYFTNDKTGQQVGTWYENPNLSPIKSILGGQYRTRSKAGWIAGWGYHAASDAGIVYAKHGPYIIAVMTNADAQLTKLNGTIRALNKLVQVLNNSHAEIGHVSE